MENNFNNNNQNPNNSGNNDWQNQAPQQQQQMPPMQQQPPMQNQMPPYPHQFNNYPPPMGQNNYPNNPWQQPSQFNNPPPKPPEPKKDEWPSGPAGGMIAAILFCVISIALMFSSLFFDMHRWHHNRATPYIIGTAFGFFALIVGIISIAVGATGMKKNKATAIATLVLGAITTFLAIISFTVFMNCMFAEINRPTWGW